MTGKFKKVRTKGEVPAGYTGPIYWRLVMYRPSLQVSPDKISYIGETDRFGRFTDIRISGENIFSSGRAFDQDGQLLPELRRPLKAVRKSDVPVRVEYVAEIYSARMSERVFDAIDSLEPGRHLVFPIDVTPTSGAIERSYQVFFAEDSQFHGMQDWDPAANELKPIPGKPGWHHIPIWSGPGGVDQDRFVYLKTSAVDGRNWFKGVGSNHEFSPELFSKLEMFGDIYHRDDMMIPMGVVDPAQPPTNPRPAASATKPSGGFMSRLFGKT